MTGWGCSQQTGCLGPQYAGDQALWQELKFLTQKLKHDNTMGATKKANKVEKMTWQEWTENRTKKRLRAVTEIKTGVDHDYLKLSWLTKGNKEHDQNITKFVNHHKTKQEENITEVNHRTLTRGLFVSLSSCVKTKVDLRLNTAAVHYGTVRDLGGLAGWGLHWGNR